MNKSIAVNLTSIITTLVLTALVTYFLTIQFYLPEKRNAVQEISVKPESDQPAIAAGAPEITNESLEEPVDVLLIGLKKRLEAQQDDVDGWILLSKSYYHVNRQSEAEEAFEQARSLGYSGNWKPLPRIDSVMQIESSVQSLKSMINFRDNKIGESDEK